MLYDYKCQACDVIFEKDFRIGTAEDEVSCPECDGTSKRFYGNCNFVLKGGGWPSRTNRMNTEMTKRNRDAGKRMRKEHGDGPVKLSALDYGDGDVREV